VKNLLILFTAAVLVLGLSAYAISEGEKTPQGKITFSISGNKPATIDHGAHIKRADNCKTCHHTSKENEGTKCTTCHTKTGKDGAPAGMKTFHKKTCKKCHFKNKKFELIYPKGCKKCHL
jgi:Class III cytochrome C family